MKGKYITIKEASDILGVSPLTLRNWDNSGKFPATRHPMNNYRVYKIEDLEKLIDDIETGIVLPTKNTPEEARKLMVHHLKSWEEFNNS